MMHCLRRAAISLGALLVVQTMAPSGADAGIKASGVYVGAAVIPLRVTGLEDLHVSDWEQWGLKSADDKSLEARVALPLSEGNFEGIMRGIRMGYSYDLEDNMTANAELGLHAGTMNAVTLTVGIDYPMMVAGAVRMSAPLRVGLIAGSMDFGATEVVPGYTPPVDVPEGRFQQGDALSASLAGGIVSAGVSLTWELTPKLGIRVDACVQYGVMGNLVIRAGDVEISQDAPSLVKADASATQAGIEPEGESLGMSGFAGVVYRL